MNIKDKRVSIIIPVYNESLVVEDLIENLDQFKEQCEIIFVDGGSIDGTKEIIEKVHRIVSSPKKGRSNQMNYGASLAEGEIFLFLHCDSFLPKSALNQIQNTVNKGHRVGCFKIKFDSSSVLMKICGMMSNLRVRYRNIAFGDQGIFITKDYFYEIGGFRELPIMEDYQFSIDIKKSGERIVLINSKIITSERRFVKSGRLKTMAKMQKLQYMYRKNQDIEIIKNLYK